MPLKKAKCEAAAQRRPAQTKRKNRVFSAKRQTAWFGTRSVSNGKCSKDAGSAGLSACCPGLRSLSLKAGLACVRASVPASALSAGDSGKGFGGEKGARGKRGDFCKSLPSSPVPPSPLQNLYRCRRRTVRTQGRTPGRTPARLSGKESVDQGNKRINPRCPHPWSIFRLKRFAFQTMRSGVSRKKRGFSAWFGPGGAVPPPRILPFLKAKCPRGCF